MGESGCEAMGSNLGCQIKIAATERLPAHALGLYARLTGNEKLSKKAKMGLKISDKMWNL